MSREPIGFGSSVYKTHRPAMRAVHFLHRPPYGLSVRVRVEVCLFSLQSKRLFDLRSSQNGEL